MSTLKAIIGSFHDSILSRDASVFTPQVAQGGRISPEERMNIYIEGYRLRLMEAIRADYPATMALLGEAFEPLAAAYIETVPPSHYSLDTYPYGFSAFARTHCHDTAATDIAALESAIAQVFFLEESPALTPEDMQGVTPEHFGDMQLRPRTAMKLLALSYDADAFLKAQRKGEIPPRPQAQPHYLCIVRHHNEVRRHALDEAGYLVLTAIAGGATVGEALEGVAQLREDLLPGIAAGIGTWFGQWTAEGFFRKP